MSTTPCPSLQPTPPDTQQVEVADQAMLDRVADAIEAARCPDREGPFGLYNYTSYGAPKPHRVRDFRDPRSDTWGDGIASFDNAEDARRLYEKLTRHHIAAAAIAAVGKSNAQDAVKEALRLAVSLLAINEPGDSRAVSDEFVALASVSDLGDTSPKVMAVIRAANAAQAASTQQEPIARPVCEDGNLCPTCCLGPLNGGKCSMPSTRVFHRERERQGR